MHKISITQGFWFKNRSIALTFPGNWRIDYCQALSDGYRRLSLAQIKRCVDNPIGCDRLELLARGKSEAAILFDDMTRPTRPYKVLPHLLGKLRSAGIKKENIRFIISAGSHGAHGLDDFRRKLGNATVANYPVYNHNCYENIKYIGTTTTGVPIYLNKEFLKCDLKIGIGSVLPHLYCGFSGGGKIAVPGVSGHKTIDRFHSLKDDLVFAKYKDNLRVKTIYEAVKMSGFQFKIDFIMNTKGEEVACFAGDPVAEFKEAVKTAQTAYRTPHGKNYDVIIANAYIKSNEADIAIQNTIKLLNPRGGIFILIAQNPHGQINHYLFRSYGKFIGGKQFKVCTFLKPNVKYVIFSPYKEYNAFDTFDRPDSLVWEKSWDAVINIIKSYFYKPKVAVFSDATIQLIQ